MTLPDFETAIQDLFRKANEEELPIDYIYDILHRQALIAETILKVGIEMAYKERFK
jgi:hypothetical protein